MPTSDCFVKITRSHRSLFACYINYNSKPGFAAHHTFVASCSVCERILFNHRSNTEANGKLHAGLGVLCRSAWPSHNLTMSFNKLEWPHANWFTADPDNHQFSANCQSIYPG